MCGICGVVVLDGPPPDRELVTRMIGRLRHRGPDGSGLYRDDHAALGHTRLAIIDTEGGAQPLSNEDEHRVDRRSTARSSTTSSCARSCAAAATASAPPATPRSSCTPGRSGASSASPASTASWPWRCGTRASSGSCSRATASACARSSSRVTRHRIAFASEVKALMADPALPRAFDPIGLDEVLTYWSTVAPRTVFAGIEQLEPGHVAVLDRDGFRRHPYWSIDFPDRGHRAGAGHRDQRRRAARAPRRGGPAALRAQRRTRRHLPLRRHRLLHHRRGDREVHRGAAAHLLAEVHGRGVRRRGPPAGDGGRARRPARGDHRLPADVAEVFPEVVRHTETPCCAPRPRRCSCCRGWCGTTATRSC